MLNKVMLIGNLGADPEVRYMPNGNAVTNINIATSRGWKDKESGERREATEWHRVVFFNRLAEVAGEYLKKGRQIYVEGRLRTNKWQTKEGEDRYTTEIVADNMQMLGSRSGGTDSFAQNSTAAPASPAQNAGANSPQDSGNTPPADAQEDFDDDIPF